MDKKYLRVKLFELDELESKKYKKQDWNLLKGKFHPKVVKIKGKEVYLFSKDEEVGQNIVINKQPRFTYIPEHVHTYIELIYVYSGQCNQIVNGKTLELYQGDILIIDQNVEHKPLETGENDIAINILIERKYFDPSLINRLDGGGIIVEFLLRALSEVSQRRNYILFSNLEEQSQILDVIDNLMCEYFQKKFNSEEILRSYIVILFCILVRDQTFETNMVIRSNNGEVVSIIEILKYIEDNFNFCTLESMGKHFGFNPNYLSRLLKKRTGKSFKEIILKYKIKHAIILLSDTKLAINEIANIVGFSNVSFFYKKFNEIHGVTPLEYRNLINK